MRPRGEIPELSHRRPRWHFFPFTKKRRSKKMRRDLLLARIAVVSGGLLITAFTACAQAQTPAQMTPAQKSDDKSAQNSRDVPLSKKLNETDGVITPPHGVDPDIHRDPPAKTGDKMPVIVPPGEPGGDQSVQPK
jgi:hypothetical protein